VTAYNTVDLLTESGQRLLTENGSFFLILSRSVVVEVTSPGGGSWGPENKWMPLDTKYTIRVTVRHKQRVWTQQKEVSPLIGSTLEMVNVSYKKMTRLIAVIKLWFKTKH